MEHPSCCTYNCPVGVINGVSMVQVKSMSLSRLGGIFGTDTEGQDGGALE